MQEKIKYLGNITKTNDNYRIEFFDKIQNKKIILEKFKKCTYEEAVLILAKKQYEFYTQYPRLLPKYITVVPNEIKSTFKYFRLAIPYLGKPIYIDSFTTLQDAIWAKKDIVSRLVE